MNASEALAKLTPAGREFMRLVGSGHFDFFDDGIVESSGNWGDGLASQAAPAMGKAPRSMGGIMLGTKKAGLWTTDEQDTGCYGIDTWWALTELGAEVALLAAGKPAGTRYLSDVGGHKITPNKPQPTDKRTRKEVVAALRAGGYDGPVSYNMPKLYEIAASVNV